MRKCIVISAVNFSEGGPLTVLRDCLSSAVNSLPLEWDIIALVHNKKLIDFPRVHLIEIADAKRSWFNRIYHEWINFKKISINLKPDLWLSLHDVTPRVMARRQIVYCHNPSPFYRILWREAVFDPKFFVFNKFYRYIYKILIGQNFLVIVQQEWLRKAFLDMYGALPLVVAHPSVKSLEKFEYIESIDGKTIFFYPALARIFKNFEVLCEAAKILMGRGFSDFEVRVTLKGNENHYARWIQKNYGLVPVLRFIGMQNRDQMKSNYQEATAVIFPSKLETWGLPISEAKGYKKALLVSDMPYAHETVGNYDQVSFFPPTDAIALADLMQAVIEKRWKPEGSRQDEPLQPFARNWDELWRLMTEGL